MIKETFRYIEYSDEKKFNKTEDGKLELRQFSDDLVFAVSFDSTFDAIKSIGSKEPESVLGSPQIVNFDVFGFGQHGELKGTVIYDEESFRILENEGSIKFYLKSDFNNAVGEQTFKYAEPQQAIPVVADYGVTIYDGEDSSQEFIISLEPTDNGLSVFNKLAVAVTGNGFNAFQTNDKIRITTTTYGNEVFIAPPTTEGVNDLIELMGGLEEAFVPNAPTNDVEFLKLSPKTSLENAITLTHGDDSNIYLKMYNYNGELIVDEDLEMWSNVPNRYYAFELNWNEQTGSLFINGKLNKIFMTGVERKDVRTFLYLNGSVPDYHHIDEFQIYDKVQHIKNYELETSPLTPYDSENPYVDIHYGQGFKENEIKDVIVDGTEGLHFCVKIGVTWYYYQNGSWRTGDGSFTQSTELDLFEAKFEELFFNESYDLILRTYFNSDGWTPVSFDEIAIIREIGDEAAAHITAEVRITEPLDLSEDSMIEITTDLGMVEVDLTSAAVDPSAVTFEEIKQAIRDANIPGLATVTDDGNGRLILIGSTTGNEGYVSVDDAVDGSALDVVWGGESSDTGEDNEFIDGGVYVDYSELFRWVRSMLGAPLVPVELTDEQLEDNLSEAVYQYNKWRNYNENMVYAQLAGNPNNGWEIPAAVGGADNITEIIMEPRYPTTYYAGRDDLYSNIFIQAMFKGTGDIIGSAADYHIALSTSKDLNIILNTEVKWEVINKRLFITPIPSNTIKVVIKYKAAMTLDEIVTSQPIRQLLLALSKITLGNIRSTFGNQVPGGDGMLQLNGSELKSEGQQDRDRIIDGWKRQIQLEAFIIG